MSILDANNHTYTTDMTPIADMTEAMVRINPLRRRWPSRNEYDSAIANWHNTVLDPEIRAGQLARDDHSIFNYGGANLYVCIYRVSNWMIRFFCTNPNHPTPVDIQERYRAIAQFCNEQRLSCLLPVTYVERGILIGNDVFPLVKMPFLLGYSPLGYFVSNNYQESEVMHQLCDAWLRMMHELEEAQVAHGDLDLTNVLVQEQGQRRLTLKLIDYDNMWIPANSGRSQTEFGHVHFQHPDFMPPNPRPYSPLMDRFSAMSIYISLRTIAERPELYDEYGADEEDHLLFTDYDYQNAGLVDSRLQQIRALNIADLVPYLDELDIALKTKRMPCSFDDITTHKLHSVHSKHPTQSSAPATSLWGQAVYNANAIQPFTPLPTTLPPPATSSTPPESATIAQNRPISPPFPARTTAKRFPWSRLPKRRSRQPVQNKQYIMSQLKRESPREEIPSWFFIILIICILLLIAVVVIFVLILQRHLAQTTLAWPIMTMHHIYTLTGKYLSENG